VVANAIDSQALFVSSDDTRAEPLRRSLHIEPTAWQTATWTQSENGFQLTTVTSDERLTRPEIVFLAIDLNSKVPLAESHWEDVVNKCRFAHQWLHSAASSDSIRRVILLTRGTQTIGDEANSVCLASHCVAAWFRSMRLESTHWRCEHFDLDPTQPVDEQWDWVADQLRNPGAEFEVAQRNTNAYVRAMEHKPHAADSLEAHEAQRHENHSLEFTAQGSIDYLVRTPKLRRPPGPDEVEIEVRSTGLNFRDVLNVLGLYPGDAGHLGGECSGFVCDKGSQVTHLQVGDCVAAIAAGSFSNYVTTHAALAVRKPPYLSFAEAACLPIATLTAAIALKHFGKIKSGDRVLIHAAAGGVGLAAVRLAMRAGSKVFATAGSEHKRQLLRSLGVHHLASSRSNDFKQDFANDLDGEQFDIVLNSLSGEFIPGSLSLLKSRGQFIEIGKIGTWSAEQVERDFPQVIYTQFDLAELAGSDPKWIGALLREELGSYQCPSDRPKIETFLFSDAQDAFRHMSQGKHVGKIAVVHPTHRQATSALFDPASTYIVTGALGAIGRQLIAWMIQHGARNLELLMHRELRASEHVSLQLWTSSNVNVTCHTIDATDLAAVNRLVSSLHESSKLVRGVFHLAGVRRDGLATESQWQDFETVLRAKALTAWNLHQSLREVELDFFVLFSSIASLFGSPSQANYAAANAVLDGLALMRRNEGLPALSIHWGPWSGEGMAETFHDRASQLGIKSLQITTALENLELLLQANLTQAAVVDLDALRFSQTLGNKLSSTLVQSLQVTNGPAMRPLAESKTAVWRERIREASNADRHQIITEFLKSTTRNVLGLVADAPLDIRQPLRELGLDSLMAVEMKNLLCDVTNVSLDTTVLFDYPTIEALGRMLSERSSCTGEAASVAASLTVSPNEVSTDTIAAQLAEELASLRLADGHSS